MRKIIYIILNIILNDDSIKEMIKFITIIGLLIISYSIYKKRNKIITLLKDIKIKMLRLTNKKISVFLLLISIINIIMLAVGYVVLIRGKGYERLHDIPIGTILVFILQILNIALLMHNINKEKKKNIALNVKIVISIIILFITLFIPVKEMWNYGRTPDYKNLYLVTIKEGKSWYEGLPPNTPVD